MTGGRQGGAWGAGFRHVLALPGWSARSAWGFDAELECFWAELWLTDADAGPTVRIAPDHLVPTVTGLARAVGFAAGLPPGDALVALTV